MRDINAAFFVRVESRRLAKLAAKQEIRDRGLKLSSFSIKDIEIVAGEWLQAHRAETVDQAFRTLVWSRFLRAQVTSGTQKSKARKSGLSVVHISCPKVEA
jgi:hypothetical protein